MLDIYEKMNFVEECFPQTWSIFEEARKAASVTMFKMNDRAAAAAAVERIYEAAVDQATAMVGVIMC